MYWSISLKVLIVDISRLAQSGVTLNLFGSVGSYCGYSPGVPRSGVAATFAIAFALASGVGFFLAAFGFSAASASSFALAAASSSSFFRFSSARKDALATSSKSANVVTSLNL